MTKHLRVTRRRLLRRSALLLSGVAVPCGWLLTAPAQAAMSPQDAAPTTHTVTVGDAAEAWYAASPIDLCTTPLGCPPPQAPTSPYPADTLHVGVAGGQETARTYLVPDLMSLPVGGTAVSGTMTLPVATGSTDGTASPGTAKIKACLATKPVTDGAQGSTSTPPSTSCAISAKAVYAAAKGVFTLDLTPFLTAWAGGAPEDGIALVPDRTGAQPTDAWHVTFNGRKRAAAPHITSVVTVQVTSDTTAAVSVPSAPAAPAAQAAPPAAVPQLPAAAAAAAPPLAAPPVVAGSTTPVQAQPVAFARTFEYPAAFLLPIVLLAGGLFFARLFTRDATPLGSGR